VGVLLLPALLISLIVRKQYQTIFLFFALASLLLIGYYVPVSAYLRNPLVAMQDYRVGWYDNWIVTYPFQAIVAAVREFDRPLWSTLYHGAWLAIALTAMLVGIVVQQRRAFWAKYPVEWIFAALYLAFILSYNSYWTWLDAARLLLPILPFMVVTFEPWLPRHVWSYVIMAPLSGFISAIPVIGVSKLLAVLG
jgi:hypothetical protein